MKYYPDLHHSFIIPPLCMSCFREVSQTEDFNSPSVALGSTSKTSEVGSQNLPTDILNSNVTEGSGINLLQSDALSSDEEDTKKAKPSTSSKQCKLPNPLLSKVPRRHTGSKISVHNSVFRNPFEKAEVAQHSILEQHVKMSERREKRTSKNICYNYKKGKCNFGAKCRFLHDNVQRFAEKRTLNTAENCADGKNFDDDSYMSEIKRRKRAGITNALLPSKKAKHALDQQRASERPWTVMK